MENNKPQVRFNGFDEDWISSKLGSIVDLENGFAFKSKFFQDKESTHIVLTPGNVNIGGGFQFGKGHYYNTNGEFSNRFVLKPNDIFLTMTDLTPTAQTLGFPALIPDDGNIYLHNQRLGKLINFDADKKFLFQLLCNPKFQKQIVLTSSGTTVKHTSPTKILTAKINYPNDKFEQQKIGIFFENLDKLISEHQQKHSKLTAIKKAMLSKMFPQKGQTVPQIRFKGFTEDWELKPLNKIAYDISDGNWIESNHIFEEGEYRIIQTGNLGVGIFLDKSNNAKYFQQKDFDEVRGNEIFPGDILMSRLAEPAGRTIILPSTGFRMVTAVDVTIIRPDDLRFDSIFLMTLLNTSNVLNVINENVSGTSHRRISRKNLEKTKLFIPLLDEQRKIGVYFKNLDELMQNNVLQIEKLQNIKKAFLAKMFI